MWRRLWRAYGMNPLDRTLRRALRDNQERFLICWNRGLGDIPLGIYALVHRIRQYIPSAQVTFLTRPDLKEGFALLEEGQVLTAEGWKRKEPFDLAQTLAELQLAPTDFDVIWEHPDPTYWVRWQLGKLVPRLKWSPKWDTLSDAFGIEVDRPLLGVHLHTETAYGYEKNWPFAHWKELIEKATQQFGVQVVIFGLTPSPLIEMKHVVDLRGKTELYEMLALIKRRCRYLLVPDSGILSLTYYLDVPFKLRLVSLWADPQQGVLKQNVPSPNSLLSHRPLIAENRDLQRIRVEEVVHALFEEENG